MGSNTSKPSLDAAAVHTQKKDLDINSDPRSPTPEIVRTPLQEKTGSKHYITKNADLRKTFENSKGEEKLIHKNPILSAVIKNHLQSYDPRSPTQDFERTPIIIASKLDEITNNKKLSLQNENYGSPSLEKQDSNKNYDSFVEAQESADIIPKNLCNGFYDLTINESIKEPDEPLGSSTASNEAFENNISHRNEEKITQLLETNFDYTETEKFEDSIETNPNNVYDDPELEGDFKSIPLFKILFDDPRSPSAGIERTPIVVPKAPGSIEENVEEMSDDKLIKVLQSANVELRQSAVNKPTSEGLLIYEDESTDVLDTPKKPKSAAGGCSSGSRTPLSCMKNKSDAGHTRSKSANTVDDPKGQKQPAKIPRRVSHIPRLKSLQIKLAPEGSSRTLKNLSKKSVGGDCENTPPQSHRDKWDKDNSIVL